jgi:hypothetical protein
LMTAITIFMCNAPLTGVGGARAPAPRVEDRALARPLKTGSYKGRANGRDGNVVSEDNEERLMPWIFKQTRRRHCERSEAIHGRSAETCLEREAFYARGLLRFARNDGLLIPKLAPIGTSPGMTERQSKPKNGSIRQFFRTWRYVHA